MMRALNEALEAYVQEARQSQEKQCLVWGQSMKTYTVT
jgi:hypothetical protein